jgi:hypothetical protein
MEFGNGAATAPAEVTLVTTEIPCGHGTQYNRGVPYARLLPRGNISFSSMNRRTCRRVALRPNARAFRRVGVRPSYGAALITSTGRRQRKSS